MVRVSIEIIAVNIDFNKIDQYLGVKATKIKKRKRYIWEYSIEKMGNNDDINDALQNILAIINERGKIISALKKYMSIVIYIKKEQFNYSFFIDNNIIKQISELKVPIKIELVSKGKINTSSEK